MDQWSPSATIVTPPNDGIVRYRWIAEYVLGLHQSNNVQRALRDKFVRVKREELPEDYIFDEDTTGEGFCRTGGLILMKISEENARLREAYYERKSLEGMNAANTMQGIPERISVVDDNSRGLSGSALASSV